MKKNENYFRTVFRRENILLEFILGLFRMFASYPRLLLEVFIRKNFGHRYFQMSSVVTVIFILGIYPVLSSQGARFLRKFGFAASEQGSFISQYFLWYAFLIAFGYMGWKHYMDNRKSAQVEDFKQFSLSSGSVNPLFFKVKIPHIHTDIRLIECFLEPALFLGAGIVLWLIGQKLGVLITVSSIVYAFSYIDAYRRGDNFMYDKNDEMICNAALERVFLGDNKEEKENDTEDSQDNDTEDKSIMDESGFVFRSRIPATAARRKEIFPFLKEGENTTTVH